jgi:putative endonuclease
MATNNTLGKEAEELAVAFFRKKGYTVLHTNWRFAYHEIDLIAYDGKLLHFIEVKFRTTRKYGFPEEKVNLKKFNCLCRAADEFLYRHPDYKKIQFDIFSINQLPANEVEYFLIEDVYL